MNVIASYILGVVGFPRPANSGYELMNAVTGLPADEAGLASFKEMVDWRRLEVRDRKEAIQLTLDGHYVEIAFAHFLACLAIEERSSKISIGASVESLFTIGVNPERVENRLLIAPLKNASKVRSLSQLMSGSGNAVFSALLDKVYELQPQLNRLCDAWLRIDFSALNEDLRLQKVLWMRVCELGCITSLLDASSARQCEAIFDSIVAQLESISLRKACHFAGRELSLALFPSEALPKRTLEVAAAGEEGGDEENDFSASVSLAKVKRPSSHKEFLRAIKEIERIVKLISEGRDSQAKQYLEELVNRQDETHAVMTLCNVAKQCADMYREDFEHRCLERALTLSQLDAWTWIQYGDLSKRVRKYKEAIASFERARELGEIVVAETAIADTYAHMGDLRKSLRLYEILMKNSDDTRIIVSRADVLRRMNRKAEAAKEYKAAIAQAKDRLETKHEIHCLMGIAELLRQDGLIKESSIEYRKLLPRVSPKDPDSLVLFISAARAFSLAGFQNEALEWIDRAVKSFPFSISARIVRGSILGVLGQELDALQYLPADSERLRSYETWRNYFNRGVLSLKLARLSDARKMLTKLLQRMETDSDAMRLARIACVVCHIHCNQPGQAESLLANAKRSRDKTTEYFSMVLKAHIEMSVGNRTRALRILSSLDSAQVQNENILRIKDYVRSNLLEKAKQLEVTVLLQLVA